MSIFLLGTRPFSARRPYLSTTFSTTLVPVLAVAVGLALSGCGDAPRADALPPNDALSNESAKPTAQNTSAGNPHPVHGPRIHREPTAQNTSAVNPPPVYGPRIHRKPTAQNTSADNSTSAVAELATPTPTIQSTSADNTSSTAPLSGSIDLTMLVDAAKRRHPTARAVAAARQAAEARAAQAGVWDNPELEVSYGRTNPRIADLNVDRPYGARLSQRVAWWGKRSARVAVASAQVAAAEAESAAALLDLEVEVRLAAISLASAQMAAEHTAQQATLAQELADVVAKRQALGDIDHGEAARIRLEATTARLRHDAAVRNVALNLSVLRAWCGEVLADGIIISDVLTDPHNTADGKITPASSTHPRIRAALEAERAAEAQANAERKARIPDVTISVFGDREYEKDTYGVSLGFDIPLWDRGSARIAEAEADRAQRAAERAAAVLTLERERIAALGDWTASAAEVIALRDQAIPVAEEALRLRTTAFQGGDASLAEVLDARRAALTVQSDLLDARRRHAEAQVRLLAATGPIEATAKSGGQP
jgi:outer membrane protein, heavy metal efflux system